MVFIQPEKEENREDSHHTAWKCLTDAIKFNKYKRLADVPKDTFLPEFAYFYAGESGLVNVFSTKI